MVLTFKVEQRIGVLPDVRYKVLFERASDITCSVENVIDVLHSLYVNLPHRVIVIFD